MRTLCSAGLIVTALIAAGCAQEPVRTVQVSDQIIGELDKGAQRAKPRESEAVNQALLPPLRMELPQAQGRPIEGRFDLNVNNAPAREVFLSIVSGTRYSMLVHPDVTGSISVNLKDVSLSEALEAIREIYGYEYKIDGSRVYIQPAGLQTRVFQVNYLIGARQGRSDMRVTAGSSGIATGTGINLLNLAVQRDAQQIQQTQQAAQAPLLPGGIQGPPSLFPNIGGALGGAGVDATRMATVQTTDYWAEVEYAIRTIVGTGGGRSIVISPQSGVVVVRAMPPELRSVAALLKAMKLSVERQVMLEAKIIDVTLNKGYQAGINWAAFPTSGIAFGFTNTQTPLNPALSPTGTLSANSAGAPTAGPATSSSFLANPAARFLTGISGVAGGVFGLAVQTRDFASMLQFLEAQGTVQVLSSPRVSTLNNQKAVLKVGTDQPFVTNIIPGIPVTNTNLVTGTSTTATSFTPQITNIFAGISLDVTPQIDESGNIILHIHPLVTAVSGTPLVFNLGNGEQSVTVAKVDVSESDTMVRTSDGNIVVLGGLMKVQLDNSRNAIPGLADAPLVGGAFRNSATGTTKRELVILIKPTIIEGDKDWEHDLSDARGRLQSIGNNPEFPPVDRQQ